MCVRSIGPTHRVLDDLEMRRRHIRVREFRIKEKEKETSFTKETSHLLGMSRLEDVESEKFRNSLAKDSRT